jgi:hypothetical protein
LIGLAEKFRLADERTREDFVVNSPMGEKHLMKDKVEKHYDEYDFFMAGLQAVASK